MARKMNRWLVRLEDKTVCIYTDQRNNAMYCKTFGANGWEERVMITDNAAGNLSVTIGEDEKLYVFCMDLNGNIMLCVNNGGKWSSNILQENRTQSVHDIYFHVSMTNDGMDILYNIPDGIEKNYGLFYRSVSKGSRWSDPIKIDTISSFNNTPFIVQRVSDKHYVVFYQTKKNEANIVYREVSFEKKKWSESRQIFKSGYNCWDIAFLTTNNAIHSLIIVQGIFSYQLMYIKKQGAEFSKPILLYEGQRIDNCLIHILDGSIYCTFFVGGQMYICRSDNMGESFGRPSKYKHRHDFSLIKTVFISSSPIEGERAFLNFVYTEEDNVGSIALVTDFYPNILIPRAKPAQKPIPSPPPKQPTENEYDSSYGFNFPSMSQGSGSSSTQSTTEALPGNLNIPITDNEFIKTQVVYLTRQIEKKEQQIISLMSQIKEKDRLAANLESSWKEKYAQASQESKSAIAELENRLHNTQVNYNSVPEEYESEADINMPESSIPDDYAQIIETVFESEGEEKEKEKEKD